MENRNDLNVAVVRTTWNERMEAFMESVALNEAKTKEQAFNDVVTHVLPFYEWLQGKEARVLKIENERLLRLIQQ